MSKNTTKEPELPKRIFIFLPENWLNDLKKSLKTNPPGFRYKEDYFKYIGQLVYFIMCRCEPEEIEESKGFVHVNKSKLQKKVNQYRRYLDYMVEHKFLEEDSSYQNEKYSGQLRYPAKYTRQKVSRFAITTQTLIKSILKTDNSQPENELEDSPQPEYLFKWLTDGQIKIDFDEAKHRLQRMMILEKSKQLKRKEEIDLPQLRFNCRMIPVYKIKQQEFSGIKIDTTAGRLHSNLTGLKKELRGALSYNGERLCSVDIVNSQPYLLTGLLNPSTSQKNKLTEMATTYNPGIGKYLQTTTNIQTHTYSYTQSSTNIDSIMLLDLIAQISDNQDVKNYIDWAANGTFYENFGQELLQRGLLTDVAENSRAAAKITTFRVLFNRNSSIGFIPEMKAFREVFPSVYEVIKAVKTSPNSERYHNSLACTLQKFEAKLILHDCCGTIDMEEPYLPIFTIHDSIITTVGNEKYVHDVMERVFMEQMGMCPKMKVEYWV